MDRKRLYETENINVPHIITKTIKKLSNKSQNNYGFPFDESSEQYISDFLATILPENLRKVTMILSLKIKESINKKSVLRGFVDDIVEQMFNQLSAYIASKDEQFKVDFVYGKVSNEFYEESFKIFVNQDVIKFSTILDYLLSIKNPESKPRCKTICIRVKELLKNPKTFENGKNWIEIFKIDTEKYNNGIKGYIDAIDDLWPELIKDTVNRIENLFPKNSLDKFSHVAAAFFRRCEHKPLKVSTMELICAVYEKLKKKRYNLAKEKENDKKNGLNDEMKNRLSDLKFVREIIVQISFEFEIYCKEKDETFIQNDFNRYVPEQLWITCFEIFKAFDINKCSSGMDLLFCLKFFESRQRYFYVGEYVRKLVDQKDTFKIGVQWTFIFDLVYVKSYPSYFHFIVFNTHLYEMETDLLPLIKQNNKYKYLLSLAVACRQDERKRFSNELIENFVKKMTVEKLRDILEIEDYKNTAKEKDFDEASNYFNCSDMRNLEIPDVKLHQNVENALRLLENENTFKNAIDIFKNHIFPKLNNDHNQLSKLDLTVYSRRQSYIKKIAYKLLIYSGGKSKLVEILTTSNDKNYYLKILDDLISRYEKNNKFFNNDEIEIKKKYTQKEMYYIFGKAAQKYKIKIISSDFFAYRMLNYSSMEKIYKNWSDNIFGFCVLQTLNDKSEFTATWNEYNLFKMIRESKRTCCCWAQYLKIKEDMRPSFLKPCKCLEFDEHLTDISEYLTAEQFNKTFSNNKKINVSCMDTPFLNYKKFVLSGKKFTEMIAESKSFCDNEDSIIECTFQEKEYKFISVKSVQTLYKFVEEYLMKEVVAALDSETGSDKNLIVVFQISTDKWFCVIDVQEICKEVTNKHSVWRKLYGTLFNGKIELIGFAFENDFKYLAHTFPSLQDIFQKPESKVFCLQKLTNAILPFQNGNHEFKNFFSENIKETCSLAKLSKEVLNYVMDKTEQSGDWTSRPLTPLQKIYAVLDVHIVLSVYKKLQIYLPEKLGNDAIEIIQKGYVRCPKEIN